MFKVGDLVIDDDGDIGVIIGHMFEDLWKVLYIDGTGEGDMWQEQLEVLCK